MKAFRGMLFITCIIAAAAAFLYVAAMHMYNDLTDGQTVKLYWHYYVIGFLGKIGAGYFGNNGRHHDKDEDNGPAGQTGDGDDT